MTDDNTKMFDLFVIGGGVNGCGIARDAAGRGLNVALAEMNDLASATSGASTKLFHGGLRYLEFFEFRLVRESLVEREVLLRAMPHIAWPMRFVLPYHHEMRFGLDTPTARLVALMMPWTRGRRPAWLIRLGLFIYDHMARKAILPGTVAVDLAKDTTGVPLDPKFRKGYEYSDVWVQDSRLVVLNARDAANRGATIMPRTRVASARRIDGAWEITLEGVDAPVRARAVINAAGPWVGHVIRDTVHAGGDNAVRLVRGSHIVTRRLYDHDRCYIFQGNDGRIIFAIPYEDDFTLIGTTECDHADPSVPATCTPEEKAYLMAFAARYFKTPLREDDIVWTYSGVRPLYDDRAVSDTAATRDYVLEVDNTAGAPLLNVFGGKITTYRKLAEAAVQKIAPYLGTTAPAWTAGVPLPGGDFAVDGADALIARLQADYPFITPVWARRLVRTYGTQAWEMLGQARALADLDTDFGATITARELDWTIAHEWVTCAEDFLWRRTKLGLQTSADQVARIESHVSRRVAEGGR